VNKCVWLAHWGAQRYILDMGNVKRWASMVRLFYRPKISGASCNRWNPRQRAAAAVESAAVSMVANSKAAFSREKRRPWLRQWGSVWLKGAWGLKSRGKAVEAPGHLWLLDAAEAMRWSVGRRGVPVIACRGTKPHGWVETVGAGGGWVRLLQVWAGVECRLSSAPPISMTTLSSA
jgi:hypothetical protein